MPIPARRRGPRWPRRPARPASRARRQRSTSSTYEPSTSSRPPICATHSGRTNSNVPLTHSRSTNGAESSQLLVGLARQPRHDPPAFRAGAVRTGPTIPMRAIGAGYGAQLGEGVGLHLQIVSGDHDEVGAGLGGQRPLRARRSRRRCIRRFVSRRDHLDSRVERGRERRAAALTVVDDEAPDAHVDAREHTRRRARAPLRCAPMDQVDVDQRRVDCAQGRWVSCDRRERVESFNPSTTVPGQ